MYNDNRVACLILAGALLGCEAKPPNPPPPRFATYQGHSYAIEVEVTEDEPHSLWGSDSSNESVNLNPEIRIRTGAVRVTIAAGKITLNGQSHGTLDAGDRIRILLDGTLLVNEQPRGGE
jgi:hypothetical protein